MPACVAHMLIARKVREGLAASNAAPEFVQMLAENSRYMELGSLGPDLPYYAIRGRWPHDFSEDSDDEPGESTWGDLLHSRKPNIVPLELIEAAWRASDGNYSTHDKMAFAFACGYLTHIAADQIVHPFVNRIAGPYYASHKNKRTHRMVEVYQDVALYASVERGDVMDAEPNTWCDVTQGKRPNTEDWFRSTLRSAFNKVYGCAPDDGDIERWVDNLLHFLGWPHVLRIYPRASRDFRQHGDRSEMVQKAFAGIDYMHACFEPAAELAAMYVTAAAKFHGLKHWDDRFPNAFLKVVSGANLTDPQPEINLDAIRTALSEWPAPVKA